MSGAWSLRRAGGLMALAFGASVMVLACVSLMTGHLHADTHHSNMSKNERDRLKEQFFNPDVNVKGTLQRLQSFEEGVVHAIEDKFHGIASSLQHAQENPTPNTTQQTAPPPAALRGDTTSHDNAEAVGRGAEEVAAMLSKIEAPLALEGEEGQEGSGSREGGKEGEVSPRKEYEEGEEGGEGGEGEDDDDELVENSLEEDEDSPLDIADLDKAFEKASQALLEKRKKRRAQRLERWHKEQRLRQAHARGPVHRQTSIQERMRQARARIPHLAHHAQGKVQLPAHHHRSPPPSEPEKEKPTPLVDEPLTPVQQANASSPARRRRRAPSPRKKESHCGGMCILNQMRNEKGPANDPDWVTDEHGTFDEDGTKAVDDNSSCRGQCGKHGFCRDGSCVCTVVYEGDKCGKPKSLGNRLKSRFNGSFLFNSEKLKKKVGDSLKYVCNPKLGNSETHTMRVKITEDLMAILPDIDPLKHHVYERCAVVGNAGVLGNYEFGPLIDSHDAVFRFNVGPTKGFEDKVGSKTTYRLVNTNHAGWHEGKEADIQQLQSRIGLLLYAKYRKMHPNAKLFAFDPEFSTYVSSNLKVLPTGGYFAVWMALQKCTKVNVFGFHFEPGFGIHHHYFNSEEPLTGKMAIHDYKAEYKRITYLAKHKYLRLMEPCIAGCESESHIPCINCPSGSACQCDTGNPMPVAKEGFCRVQGSFTCFLKCTGEDSCPSQLKKGAEANKEEGGCPPAVMKRREEGELQCEPTPPYL